MIVGLGNPGIEYQFTPHNMGFLTIDRLADELKVEVRNRNCKALTARAAIGDEQVLLAKPETFMNLSGRCVRQALDFYQVPLEELLVVCDDFNLPLGKLRFRPHGTHGGHNGLRDIQQHLGTAEYTRLRIGVGAPPEEGAVDHVLSRFRPAERPVIDDALAAATQAVVYWIHHGIEKAMNQYNA